MCRPPGHGEGLMPPGVGLLVLEQHHPVLLKGLTCHVQDGDLFCGELVFAPHSDEQGAASPVGIRGDRVSHHLNIWDGAGCPLSTEDSPHI